MLGKLWAALLDLLYPPKCPLCKRTVALHGAWCDQCLYGLLAPREINLAARGLTYLDSCWVVSDYTAGVKILLHDVKFRSKEEYVVHLRWLLVRGLAGRRFIDADMVIPVPLAKARLVERGFNQTALLFAPWAKAVNLEWRENVLARVRETAPQWELSAGERRTNVKGAFAVTRPEYVQDKSILLVDDIFTSGMTMNECANVLKKAGARRIAGLALTGGGE